MNPPSKQAGIAFHDFSSAIANINFKAEKISLSFIQNTKTLHKNTPPEMPSSQLRKTLTNSTAIIHDEEESLFSITLWEAVDIDSYEEGLSCGM